jgi:hypothetical protein
VLKSVGIHREIQHSKSLPSAAICRPDLGLSNAGVPDEAGADFHGRGRVHDLGPIAVTQYASDISRSTTVSRSPFVGAVIFKPLRDPPAAWSNGFKASPATFKRKARSQSTLAVHLDRCGLWPVLRST